MNILSLFDGISCARVALDRANIKVDKYFSSEIDKYAIQVSTKNWPDIIQLGDVKNITKDTISSYQGIVDIDLIIGGFCCQSYSIAGNKKGIDDDRGKLVFECKRLVDELKPKFFIFENVNSMSKENKKFINELFGIEYTMIDAALVSAQKRKRIWWVGKRQGNKYVKIDISQPEDKNIFLKDILEGDVENKYYIDLPEKSFCIDANYAKGASYDSYLKKHRRQLIRIGQIGNGGQGERIYSPEGKSVNLNANGGGRGAKTGLYLVQKAHGYNKGKKISINDKCPTLTTSSWEENNKLSDGSLVRKLTPIEAERLMSLDDNYTEGISSSQRYKCCGNAFNCEVVKHILSFIK